MPTREHPQNQIERDLGVSYKTAWYLNHRLRKAMEEGVGLFTGTVEADETYISGNQPYSFLFRVTSSRSDKL
jgi:hypothetical protein